VIGDLETCVFPSYATAVMVTLLEYTGEPALATNEANRGLSAAGTHCSGFNVDQ
jgi:hypothetical protein